MRYITDFLVPEEGVFKIMDGGGEAVFDFRNTIEGVPVLTLTVKSDTTYSASIELKYVHQLVFGVEKASYCNTQGVICADFRPMNMLDTNGHYIRPAFVRRRLEKNEDGYWMIGIDEGFLDKNGSVKNHNIHKLLTPVENRAMVNLMRSISYYLYEKDFGRTRNIDRQDRAAVSSQKQEEPVKMDASVMSDMHQMDIEEDPKVDAMAPFLENGDVREVNISICSDYNTKSEIVWAYAVNNDNGNKFTLRFPGLLPPVQQNEIFCAKISLIGRDAYFIEKV